MKGYIKIPVKYEFDKLNVKITFNYDIGFLEKYTKNRFMYIQILADDNTRSIVEENFQIDELNTKIILNIPLEVFDKYIRSGEYIYVKSLCIWDYRRTTFGNWNW